MTPSLVLLHILGAVALLLFGLRLVRNGVMRAFGVQLRKIISISMSNRFTAFGSGIIVTAFLQSSTAATMIISTFAGQGLITTVAALAVILGADVGTTLVAQLLTLNMSWISPVLLIAGYVFYSAKETAGARRQVGRIFVGLGLMLLALVLIKQASIPLKESDVLPVMLSPLDNDPVLTIFIGALITWICHSSLAIVLLLVSLVSAETIPLHLAFMLILGANIGSVLSPLLAGLKDTPAAARIPAGNLIMRLVGAFFMLWFVDDVSPYLEKIAPAPERMLINFHMIFNIALAIAFLPFLSVLEKILVKFIPEKKNEDDQSQPKYLDERVLDTPAVALTNAARESLRIADLVDQMLRVAWDAVGKNDPALVQKAKAIDVVVDKLYKAVKFYLVRLGQEALTPEEARRHFQILTFATNLEHVGDVIDHNILPIAEKKSRHQKNFSTEGQAELDRLCSLVVDSVRLAQTVFISGDMRLARQLVEDKVTIKHAETKATHNHLWRLQQGNPDSIATSDIHTDLLRDLRRINSLMASIAYPILEEAGELHETLLRKPSKKDKSNNDSVKSGVVDDQST